MRIVVLLLIASLFAAHPVSVRAFETDQYNLSPVPLADIGDEVSEYVETRLVENLQNINSQISRRKLCVEMASERGNGCGPVAKELEKLSYLRSEGAIADEFARLMAGDNLTTTKFGGWIYNHKFPVQPDRYKTGWGESIYILNPPNYLSISPTVRLYGGELGIDKLEHFFQQGYQYYEIERKALVKGSTPEEAVKKAVDWGMKTERTYYGLWTSGVYSYADLYANYAGMRFYHGLTKATSVGKTMLAPVAILENGYWKINGERSRDQLLKPFISDHMNEALNPSAFRITLVRSVRRAVKRHACEDWHKLHPNLTAAELRQRSQALELWNGEDYGYTRKRRTVAVVDECFGRSLPVDQPMSSLTKASAL